MAEEIGTGALAKDEVLIQKGDPSSSLFFIRRGWVKVVIAGPENNELVLNQIGPGEIIGESSLIDRAPRSTSVIAISPVQVMELKYDTFLAALEQCPQLALTFMGNMFDRLRYSNLFIEKAIEWSQYIAEGKYGAVQGQIQTTQATIVDMGQASEIRIGAFLSALFKMVKGVRRREETLEQVILPLGVALSAEKNLDRLLERVVMEAKSVCDADAGTLYLRTPDDSLRFAIMRTDSLDLALGGTTGKPIDFPPLPLYDDVTGEPNNNNVATYAALTGQSVNIPDMYHADEFDFSATESFDRNFGYRSISSLTVPLKNHTNEVIGVLQVLNTRDPANGEVIPFDSYHQLVVDSLASQAAVALNNGLLLRRQEMLLKFEHDLQIGRQIQVDFLPDESQLPQPLGWEIAARFKPAREVAGDFYDAFTLTHDKIGIVIADVCDKGVGAALFMSLSRSLLRAFAEQPHHLGWLDSLRDDKPTDTKAANERLRMLLSAGSSALIAVELTNNYIANNHGDMTMFATLFFGVLNPATGMLTYINGGHNPPVIVSATGVIKERLAPTGPAVGMLPDSEFGIKQVTLDPGDLLMTFTDGVPEARNPNGDFFTDQRLLSILEQPDPTVAALLDRIEATLQNHIAEADQFDDITMLAVRRAPEAEV
jgi:sigma-B regulation protein RsbU (phosphoserine phosphatase)